MRPRSVTALTADPVEEARALPEFFAKSPASAPHRVAIIDTADDLNQFGANAVLSVMFDSTEIGGTMDEIIAFGTAVVITPLTADSQQQLVKLS